MPKHLTINLKIIAMQCISLALLVGVLGFCLFQLVNLSRHNKESILLANDTTSVMAQLDNMNFAVIREAKASKDAWLRGTDMEEKEKARGEFTDQIDNFNSSHLVAKEVLGKLVKQDASLEKTLDGLEKANIEHKKISDI